MNILDIIILICLVAAIVQGVRKGFVSQTISIISLIAGVWASAKFADVVGGWLAHYINTSEQILKIISFATILIVAFILLALLCKMLEKIIELTMLEWLNKLLGVTFSLTKCTLILSIIAIAFNSINTKFGWIKPDYLSDSMLYPIIKGIADIVFPYLKSLFA